MAQAVILSHLTATLAMVGIIWFVQVVHYPLFERVGKRGFQTYSATHSRFTDLVVGPPMLVETATAVALLFSRPSGVPAHRPRVDRARAPRPRLAFDRALAGPPATARSGSGSPRGPTPHPSAL